MESRNIKKLILPFSLMLLLSGCKEAEIEGVWLGAESNFDKRAIISLITNADKTLTAKDLNVSALESAGNRRIFYVVLEGKAYSRVQLDALLANIKMLQEANDTALTIKYTDIADAGDESERMLLSVLQKTGMEQKGSQSTNIDWGNAKVSVYTQQLTFMGYTDPYSDINKKVYCQLKLPFTHALKGYVIEKPFPYITSSEVPESIANGMSEKEREDYINEENGIRRYVNIGLQIRGVNYPHTTTFSDAFLSKFNKNEGALAHSAPMTYSTDEKSITFYYGAIPDANYVSELGDLGGLLHHKCESMIKNMSPELEKKWTSSVELGRIGSFTVNPAWQPEE